VRALQGDVSIAGANVTIDTADNTSTATQELRMRQSGASLTFSSPVVNALQSMAGTMEAAGQTRDSRTQALATANTAMAAYNAYNSLATASALNISLSVGNSRSQSHSEQSASIARTSSVTAGGNLTIKATGKEPGQGNLTAIGANLGAGNNASLSATNDIDLRAAQNSATQTSSNSSSSASVGIGFSLGGAQNGFTINAAASQARGNSDGTDVTNTLTTVSAGNNLSLTSGRDTNLIGAVASGNSVTANVGRNLDLQSVQDTSTFASKEQSAGVGVSICVYPLCVGTSSASISASSGRANGNFASVAEQSGLRAGDGGFQVNVQGNTNLTGAAITSSQAALDGNKNSLSTTTLTQSEIQNRDNHRTSSIAASASYTSARTEYNPDTDQAQTARNRDGSLSQASNSQGLGVGSISGSQGSTTTSAISGATVTIKSGDTTALATIDRTAVTETASANALTRNWNGHQLQQDANTQAQQMLAFGQSAPRLVADFAGQRYNDLMRQAQAAADAKDSVLTDQLRAEAARWAEGGAYRVAAHAALGALAGGVDGALSTGVVAQAAPLLDTLQTNVQARLEEAGMSPQAARTTSALISTGAATLVGAVAGSGNAQAAAMAGNVDANNRQLHPTEVRRIRELARGDAAVEARLAIASCALIHCSAQFAVGSDEYQYWRAIEDKGAAAEFSAERALLSSQRGTVGTRDQVSYPMFQYGTANALADGIQRLDNTYAMGTRAGGALQMAGGGVGVIGAGLAAPTCATGVACLAVGALGVFSADQAVTGARQLVSGQPQSTGLNEALQSIGLSPEAANYAEMFVGVGVGAGAARSINGTRPTTSTASEGTAAPTTQQSSGASGQTLFRGTSEGYAGNPGAQAAGVTPTTTDPVVATLFATHSNQFGRGVIHIAADGDIATATRVGGNAGTTLPSLEREVGVAMSPQQFADSASITITASQGRTILSEMGINVPASIRDPAKLQEWLLDTARLTSEQTAEFLRRATEIGRRR
jgi:filamentous hemagglutinin